MSTHSFYVVPYKKGLKKGDRLRKKSEQTHFPPLFTLDLNFSHDRSYRKGAYPMQRNSIKIARIILVLFFLVSSYRYEVLIQPPSQETDAYVILLHGLGQSKSSMEKIGKSLSSLGYKVVNVGYPSTKYPIEFLADEILSDIIEPYSKHSQSKIILIKATNF